MSQVSPNFKFEAKLPIPKIEFGLIKAHAWAALAMVLIAVTFGILVSLKLHWPDFLGGQAWLTWGRLRYNHTQGIFFGWLGNAFLMFLYYAVPMLSMRPVVSRRLGWLLFALWNFAVVLPGWVLVLAGVSQPLEWGEFPLIVDAFVVVAFAISAIQFAVPLLKTKLSSLYVSGWYILGALIFTLLAYPVGNIVPQLLPGAQGAAFSGLWIHDAIGLYVTPLAVAIAFFVVPIATNRPIYSHFLSMLGFWLLFFVYPLNGTHHYVFSAIPMDAQKIAIMASVFLGMDVILVVTNLLMTLKNCGDILKKDVSLRFVWMGVIIYLIVSLQGSMQSLLPVNKLTHFSDWVIGHSHLAMLGFATFTAIGGMSHVWQRIPNARFNNRMLSHTYWLLLIGLFLMVSSLTIAGLVEARLWESALPWLDSVRSAKHYWMIRSSAAIPLLSGFICLVLTFSTGKRNELSKSATESAQVEIPSSTNQDLVVEPGQSVAVIPRGINMAYCAASVAGFGFFFSSFTLLGIIPGLVLQTEVNRTKPATTIMPTEQEQRGRLVYAREGCAYCHTQQVRSVA
ncbi:MAG: cbb3-type cytochrome c oxidase subunit I, partial [Leptolyngbya sp.]|nr:cbb3-type cytochrome c oxidase subunit I [Candidatus Melainabacteria bacterium]